MDWYSYLEDTSNLISSSSHPEAGPWSVSKGAEQNASVPLLTITDYKENHLRLVPKT